MEKFDGFHKEVTKSFAKAFDGAKVEIGDIKFRVTKSFVAKATRFPQIGENGLGTKVLRDNTRMFF